MPEHYTEETLKDPLIQKVAEKFSYAVEDEFTRRRPLYFPCRLSVKIGGKWHSASVDAPLGDYTNPLSEAELMEKFHRLCDPVLGNERSVNLERLLMFQGHENTLKEIESLICVCGKGR